MSYQSINPFNGETLKSYDFHDQAKIDKALNVAEDLINSDWSRKDLKARLDLLQSVANEFEKNKEELATLISTEMGKLISQSRGEVDICIAIARYYAEHAEQYLEPRSYKSDLGEAWVEHHPLGIIVAVEPWNFPFYQLMRVFAPNCAIGNPVVAKHASIVPQCAERFEQVIEAAGAPKGVWTNLFIKTDEVAKIIEDKRVQGVALTGSEGAGSSVAEQAGKHIKKSTLELGGNDVFIVLDDADLEKAIKVGCMARVNNAGQVCTAAKRFILHKDIAEQFKQGLVEAFKALKMGDPLDESTTLGPLSSESARDNLAKQVQKAIDAGANLVLGGEKGDQKGFFYQATIIDGITEDNPAWYEEFFGPVAQLYIANDDDEIVQIANKSNYGLGGAIHSSNIERAKTLASRVETGMVFINSLTQSSPELPFGGVKRSGYGRELSDLGFYEFVQKKLVVISQ